MASNRTIRIPIQEFAAAFVATAWLVPWLCAFGLALAMGWEGSLPRIPGRAVSYGVILGLAAWPVIAAVYSPMTRPARAKPRSYGDLTNLLGVLQAKCQRSQEGSAAEVAARGEANEHLNFVHSKLDSGGLEWVNGSGYMVAWQRAHRAEEALLGRADAAELYTEVLDDELQLDGSRLPNRRRLEDLVSRAKKSLRPDETAATPGKTPGSDDLGFIRASLREVRYAINDFRDTTWNGLLQLRNQTMAALILTEIAAFTLLGIGVLAPARQSAILAGVAFFLVGASVGLFNRLYHQSQADSAVEDYGLTTVSLLALPVFSGLAGVGGVLLFSLGSQPSVAADAALERVFDLQGNSMGLVTAAVFGAAPGLLLRRLGERAESYKSDLRSTQPSLRSGDSQG